MTTPATTDSARRTGAATVILCLFVTILEGFDLQAAGVAGPALAPDLGIPEDAMGVFFSSSTFGLLIGAFFGGWLADLFGRKRTLIGAVAAFGLASVATGLANDYNTLLAARAATGLGIGAALPILIALISENAPPSWKNTAIAIAYAGLPLGGATSAAIAWAGGGQEWRLIFYVGGFAPLVVVPLLIFFLPESSAFRAVRAAGGRSGGNVLEALAGARRWRATLLLWGAFFGTLLVLYLLLNWLPSLMVAQGFSSSQAAILQIVFNLAGAIGGFAGGAALDRARPSVATAVFFVGAGAAMLALAAIPNSFTITLAVIFAAGLTIMATQAILYALAPSAYPVRVRGAGVGAAVAVGRFGSVAGPLLAGAMLSAGSAPAELLYLIMPCLAVGGVLAVALLMTTAARPDQTDGGSS